jgi:Trk-type K+ transport system membrane component
MPWPSLPPTADVVETVWTACTAFGTLVAAIGAGITTTNLRSALRAHQRATTTAPVNRLHTMITEQAVRNESISAAALALLLAVLALFVAIGVYAMFSPDPIRAELREVDLVTTVVLVVGAAVTTVAVAMLAVGSVLNRRDRHRLVNRITGQLIGEQMERRQSGGGRL